MDNELMSGIRGVLRHTVAAIAYRTAKVLDRAPQGFADCDAGHEIRKPREILAHMSDVLSFAAARLTGQEPTRPASSSWEEEILRFQDALIALDAALEDASDLKSDTALRLLQGPLADALTHVGQLATLRRISGAPLPAENFFAADVEAGNVSLERTPSSGDA